MKTRTIDIKLIKRSFTADLTNEEQKQFEDWYIANRSHKLFYDNYRKFQDRQSDVGYISDFEFKYACDKFNKSIKDKTNSNRTLTFLRYAVSIVLILSSSYFSYWIINRKIDKESISIVRKVEIKPGEKKAFLELADGTQYSLNSAKEKTFVESDGSEIKADSNSVNYVSDKKRFVSAKLVYNKLVIPRGGEFKLTLSDGTIIWLNSDTKLKYPIYFGKGNREVFLEGEAYFEVAKNKMKPFVVVSNNHRIEVLGTKFNVNAYDDRHMITTTLVEGRVSVFSNKNKAILTPGMQSIAKGDNLETKNVDVSSYLAWVNGKFVFEKQRLEDILDTLSRWYDFQVFYENKLAKEVVFSGDMQRFDSIYKILDLLKEASDVDFKIRGKTIIVRKMDK